MGDDLKSRSPIKQKKFSEYFDEAFPYYLSIGMTYDQYWEGESTLVKAYREAEKFRIRRMNEAAWLQGRYFYDAILLASPILHDFVKKGTKPLNYDKKPYDLFPEKPEEKLASEVAAEAGADFARMIMAMNAQRQKGGNDSNG